MCLALITQDVVVIAIIYSTSVNKHKYTNTDISHFIIQKL